MAAVRNRSASSDIKPRLFKQKSNVSRIQNYTSYTLTLLSSTKAISLRLRVFLFPATNNTNTAAVRCRSASSDIKTCLFNLLKTKRNLLYIRHQSVPRSKHFPTRL
jgi:hypothetical protein